MLKDVLLVTEPMVDYVKSVTTPGSKVFLLVDAVAPVDVLVLDDEPTFDEIFVDNAVVSLEVVNKKETS